MPVRCPHCGSVVEPLRGASGPVCPACSNTGRLPPVAEAGAPGPGPSPSGWTALPGAAASLPPQPPSPVLAIVSLVLGAFGLMLLVTILLAPLSLVLGGVALGLGIAGLRKAKAWSRANPAAPPPGLARGLAIAGTSVGAVALVLGAVVVLVFVSLFSALADLADEVGSDAPQVTFDRDGSGTGGEITVVAVDDGLDWSDLRVDGTASCAKPTGSVDPGDRIVCAQDGTVQVWHRPTGSLVYSTSV